MNDQLDNTPEPTEDALPENTVTVEDSGTLKKKISVTVHRDRIDAKMDEMYGELSQSAQIPGFRPGRAPRRLIEKRYGTEIAGDVRNALIGEALGSAIEEADLNTIGEPDLDLDAIELPDEGDMEFSFEVEIMPEFDLPELEGIEVTKPQIEITDDRVDEFLQQIREGRASFEESDQAAEKGDIVQAAAVISGEDVEAEEHPGLSLRVAAGQIEGLPMVELGDKLAGKKPGDSVELTVTAPTSHPKQEWQGKELTVKVEISSLRKRKLPELDDELAKSSGFDDLADMREYVKAQLSQRLLAEAQQNKRQQVMDYLLENVEIDVPEGVAARHTAQTLQRSYINLLQQGVPRERIDENMAEIQASATQQAQRDLKLQFILGKIIEEKKIFVGEDEVNSRIAQMAIQYNRRPERLRQELAADGTLDQVRQSMAEEKALNLLLEKANEVEAPDSDDTQAKPEKKAAKKSDKKDDADADSKSEHEGSED
ncbi:MAG: trigger factor [Planctomycetota bacterium]